MDWLGNDIQWCAIVIQWSWVGYHKISGLIVTTTIIKKMNWFGIDQVNGDTPKVPINYRCAQLKITKKAK